MPAERFLVWFACLALACGGDPAGRRPADRPASGYRLAAVGDADLVLHPGESHPLRVVLAQEEIGTVANARIHFELTGDPGGATLESQDAFTAQDGTAEVAFRAGNNPGIVDITASAPGLDAADVSFGVEVVPVRKQLRIVAAPGTAVDQDGQTASVAVGAPGSVALRVRATDADTGAPIVGDTVVFTLPGGTRASLGRAGEKSATALTNATGEAQAFLMASEAEDFEASAYCAIGGEPVYFAISAEEGTVPPEPPPCEPGDPSCALPCDPPCGPGTHCDGDGPRCVPDPDAMPDVTGVWYTKHVFGIRQSIPLVIRDVFTGIRV
ncbi:MAG TPA: hypothetical protein VG496_07190, partial [Myxococcales bacterium]|nr:hypothetical protein [Myxococcales bacterium]